MSPSPQLLPGQSFQQMMTPHPPSAPPPPPPPPPPLPVYPTPGAHPPTALPAAAAHPLATAAPVNATEGQDYSDDDAVDIDIGGDDFDYAVDDLEPPRPAASSKKLRKSSGKPPATKDKRSAEKKQKQKEKASDAKKIAAHKKKAALRRATSKKKTSEAKGGDSDDAKASPGESSPEGFLGLEDAPEDQAHEDENLWLPGSPAQLQYSPSEHPATKKKPSAKKKAAVKATAKPLKGDAREFMSQANRAVGSAITHYCKSVKPEIAGSIKFKACIDSIERKAAAKLFKKPPKAWDQKAHSKQVAKYVKDCITKLTAQMKKKKT